MNLKILNYIICAKAQQVAACGRTMQFETTTRHRMSAKHRVSVKPEPTKTKSQMALLPHIPILRAWAGRCKPLHFSIPGTVDGTDPGAKLCKYGDKLPANWCRMVSINNIDVHSFFPSYPSLPPNGSPQKRGQHTHLRTFDC